MRCALIAVIAATTGFSAIGHAQSVPFVAGVDSCRALPGGPFIYGFNVEKQTMQCVPAPAALVPTPATGTTTSDEVDIEAENLKGSNFVVFWNSTKFTVKSIICEKWKMVGSGSWGNQNNYTIPPRTIAIINAAHFQGNCPNKGDIKIQTSGGLYLGVLNGGAGDWVDSTELLIEAK